MTELYAHIPPALLVIFRVTGLTVFGPLLGSPAIPVRVKVGLAFLIGGAVYPQIAAEHFAGTTLELTLWSLGPLVAAELLIGLVIGFIAALPMVAVQTGGLVMGQQMGLGFARFYNPGIDDEADVLGQILFFMTLAAFLAVGGHVSMVRGVLDTFAYVPLGGFVIDLDTLSLVLGLLISAFELALRIAAPLLALIFLQTIALGFMAKTVPQLNILSLGFLVRIIVGIGVVMVGLVVINDVIVDDIDETMNRMFEWIHASGG